MNIDIHQVLVTLQRDDTLKKVMIEYVLLNMTTILCVSIIGATLLLLSTRKSTNQTIKQRT